MSEGLKKTGKIALYIITPTVILIIVLFCIWAYKKYKKKNDAKSLSDEKPNKDEKGIPNPVKIESKLGVIKEKKEEESEKDTTNDDDSKVIDDVKVKPTDINTKNN